MLVFFASTLKIDFPNSFCCSRDTIQLFIWILSQSDDLIQFVNSGILTIDRVFQMKLLAFLLLRLKISTKF